MKKARRENVEKIVSTSIHAGIIDLGGATKSNYQHSRMVAKRLLAQTQDEGSRTVIAGMVSDCNYVLEWLETGRRPGSVRGIERGYEVRLWDPAWLESYQSPSGWTVERESRDLTADELFRIEEAMAELSPRERQCFMLYHVDGMSFGDISRELHIGRSTIQTNIERAREKIEYAKLNSLFLME
ncbi:sigma-70 family RNA polymerase sigma factor [Paenibacillus chitinolyticus]|uniref:sigma-70 family RNA polymerase sigma factor n=1 Tax=Paenibacillus chitinolyticus TaxID=79263 RepID=UPI0036567DEB